MPACKEGDNQSCPAVTLTTHNNDQHVKVLFRVALYLGSSQQLSNLRPAHQNGNQTWYLETATWIFKETYSATLLDQSNSSLHSRYLSLQPQRSVDLNPHQKACFGSSDETIIENHSWSQCREHPARGAQPQ